MTKREETLYQSLLGIRNELHTVIESLKLQDGIVSTEILNLIDDINTLSVEI